MSRPEKHTVDYFQHDCVPKKTLFILEENYGNDGYAVWFKLLEQLGKAPKHIINLSNKNELRYFSSKMKVSEDKCISILNLLSELEAIDQELWEKKLVWSQNFVNRLSLLYVKRVNDVPQRPTNEEIIKMLKKKVTRKKQ